MFSKILSCTYCAEKHVIGKDRHRFRFDVDVFCGLVGCWTLLMTEVQNGSKKESIVPVFSCRWCPPSTYIEGEWIDRDEKESQRNLRPSAYTMKINPCSPAKECSLIESLVLFGKPWIVSHRETRFNWICHYFYENNCWSLVTVVLSWKGSFSFSSNCDDVYQLSVD